MDDVAWVTGPALEIVLLTRGAVKLGDRVLVNWVAYADAFRMPRDRFPAIVEGWVEDIDPNDDDLPFYIGLEGTSLWGLSPYIVAWRSTVLTCK